jgi:DNA mismatch repair protein MutS2
MSSAINPTIGDQALVTKLNKHGRIVEIKSDGSVIVEIGNIKVRCTKDEFRITGTAKGFDRGTVSIKAVAYKKGGTSKVDLHGMTVVEGLRAAEEALNRALISGHEKLEIIHGIGSGALKNAILKYLSSAPGVANFANTPGNAGMTVVYLNS